MGFGRGRSGGVGGGVVEGSETCLKPISDCERTSNVGPGLASDPCSKFATFSLL